MIYNILSFFCALCLVKQCISSGCTSLGYFGQELQYYSTFVYQVTQNGDPNIAIIILRNEKSHKDGNGDKYYTANFYCSDYDQDFQCSDDSDDVVLYSNRNDCLIQTNAQFKLCQMKMLGNGYNCYDKDRNCQFNRDCVQCQDGNCVKSTPQYDFFGKITGYSTDCVQIDSLDTFIGFDGQNGCDMSYKNDTNIMSCSSSRNTVCLDYDSADSITYCKFLPYYQSQIVGKIANNYCYYLSYQFIPQVINYCLPAYCILQINIQYRCADYNDRTNPYNIIGYDNTQNCIISGTQNGQASKCRFDYCLLPGDGGTKSCVKLDYKKINQIAKQKITELCLSIDSQTNISINCAPNFCLEQSSNNCVPLQDKKGYRGKLLIKDYCSDQSSDPSYPLQQCLDGYCVSNNQCISFLSDANIVGKSLSEQCVYLPNLYCQSCPQQCQPNVISPILVSCNFKMLEICLYSGYCYFLNGLANTNSLASSNGQCSSQVLYSKIGTNDKGDCLSQGETVAVQCSNGYCLNENNSCQKYNDIYIGRDKNYKCLIKDQEAIAVQCQQDYCLKSNQKSKSIYCVKVDNINGVVGIQIGNQNCILVKDMSSIKASVCANGQYCMNSQSYCQNIQQGMCAGLNQQCVDKNNPYGCLACDSTSCLNQFRQCVQITNDNQLCQDNNGNCAYYLSNNCNFCPQYTCKDPVQKFCIPMIHMKLLSNQCLVQIRNDLPCQIHDMNVYLQQILVDPNYQIQCADTYSRCTSISGNFCSSCPVNYIQPGNGICYNLLEQQGITQQQLSTFLNNLNLQYVVQSIGIYDNQLCPQNCFSCLSQKICTRCLFSYYLIQIDPNNIICVQANVNQPQEIKLNVDENLFYNGNRLFYLCTLDGFYQGQTYKIQPYIYDFPLSLQQVQIYDLLTQRIIYNQKNFIDCQNFIQYEMNSNGQIVSYEYINKRGLFHQFSQSTIASNIILSLKQDNPCGNECASCYFNWTTNQSICLKCNAKYALRYDGKCVGCQSNCTKCIFGGFFSGQSIDWTDTQSLYSLDFMNKLSNEEYTLKCITCDTGFTINSRFDKCVQCSSNCSLCYTGMTNYNHSQIVNFNRQYTDNLNLVYKCVQCIDSTYTFSNDDQTCQLISSIQNCDVQLNLIQSVQLSLYPFPYVLRIGSWGLNSKTTQYCFNCTDSYYNRQNIQCLHSRTYCLQFLQTFDYNSYNQCYQTQLSLYDQDINQIRFNCLQPLFDSNDKVQRCNQCKQSQCNYDINGNFVTTQPDQNKQILLTCTDNIKNCDFCYTYQSEGYFIYQCTQCKSGYVVSFEGCLPCPVGCTSCYLSDGVVNISDQLTFVQPFYSFSTRQQAVQNKQYKFSCTSCDNNYYLNYQNNLCYFLNCDQTCSKCYYYNQIFKCQQCNTSYLISKLQNIIGYIALFYFNQNYIDINLMLNFNTQHSACHVCPYACQTCEKGGDISVNQFLIYNSKCKKCKDNLQIPQVIPQNEQSIYQWRYDSYRQKCVLCRVQDKGCTYQLLPRQIYGHCGSNQDDLGDGSLNQPINIQRSNEINWDALIINQQDFYKYVTFYNEISLEFLDVQLIIKDDSCLINQQISIKSTLLNQILTLNRFSLTIMNYKNNQLNILSKIPIKIQGFSDVTFLNLLLQTQISNTYNYQYGFQVSNSILKNVNLTNVQILNQFTSVNNFIFEMDNLIGVFYIKNVTIQGFQIQNSNFFTLNYQSQNFDNSRLLIIAKNSSLFNMNFNKGSLIQIASGNLYIEIDDFQILQSSLNNSSIFINIQPGIQSKSAYSNWTNISIKNCFITQNSMIFSYNYFQKNVINNLVLVNNQFLSSQYSFFFQQNILYIFSLLVQGNTFKNYGIFENYQQPSIVYNDSFNYIFVDINISSNNIASNSGLIFRLNGNILNPADQIKINVFNLNIDNTFDNQSLNNLIYVQSAISFWMIKFTINNSYSSIILNLNNIQNIQISKGVITGIQLFQADLFKFSNIINIISIQKIQILNIISSATVFTLNNNLLLKKPLQVSILEIEATSNQLIVKQISNNVGLFVIKNNMDTQIVIKNITLINNYLYSQVASLVQYLQVSPGFNVICQGQLILQDGIFNDNQSDLTNPVVHFTSQNILVKNCQFQTINQQKDNFNLKGGFAYLQADQISIINSSFTGQKAINGGAIYVCSTGIGQILIRNSQFASNQAFLNNIYSMGGAIYVQTNLANFLDISLENSQFQNNFAIQGAVIYLEKTNVKTYVKFQEINLEDNFSLKQSIILFLDATVNQILNVNIQDCFIFNTIQNMQDQIKQMKTQLQQTPNQLDQQYHYIYIAQATVVSISNLQFQQKLTIFNENNQQNFEYILPIPIMVINALSYSESFSKYFDTVTNNEIMHIQANLIELQSIQLQQIITQQEDQQAIKLKGNTIEISNCVFDNIVCLNCTLGNINIEVNKVAYITKSTFQNSISYNGGGIFLQSSIQQISNQVKRMLLSNDNPIKTVQLFGNTIQNNTATNFGGGIYLNNIYSLILNTTVQKNSAYGQGGGIYNFINQTLFDNDPVLLNFYQLYNVIMQNSYVIYNSALNGGGYYSTFNLPYIQNSFILSNKAYSSGSNLLGLPSSFQVYFNNNLVQQNSNIKIVSGKIQQPFVVYLMNDKYQIYKNLEETDIYLEVQIVADEPNQEKLILQNNKIKFQNNLFDLSNLAAFGQFGQKSRVVFSCNKLGQAIYQQGNIVQINKNITFQVDFQILNECPIGQRSTKINNTYDSCVYCLEKTYNLQSGQSICQKCQSSSFQCSSSVIQITDGYYRTNNLTDDIQQCSNWSQNCLGDIKRDNSLLNQLRATSNWAIYYCAEGNTGIFCEDCDNQGEFWQFKYMRYEQYRCQKCTDSNVLQTIVIAVVLQIFTLSIILIVIFNIWSKLYQTQLYFSKRGDFTLECMKFLDSFRQKQKSHTIICFKILFCYFQLLFMITQLELQLPWPVTFLLIALARYQEFVLRSFDCFVNQIPIAYAKNIISILYFLAINILIIILAYLLMLFKSRQIRWKYINNFTKSYFIHFISFIFSLNYFIYSPSIVHLLSQTVIQFIYLFFNLFQLKQIIKTDQLWNEQRSRLRTLFHISLM
ncbi:transmembrane protein, putative (macronuclear) [Tetrahymena thermophila SB210]|uniref:Transmembrane protein, putative n=1 Tax=Tetrahymena thermophila (strain SB210) TaxID=312017 RepID=Q22TV2_TETTS|nr:transmembrane protein, putative [Tetrahymena thermophila SB210]EAR88708.2 transmembrane protein, putative [Tetrahymena thermophila SB210]|eukprot:XP_001008953.2 transmembrane protein, putative [Tetrahymena thermophila SB210]